VRLVTWNCRVGGFRKKAKHVAPLQPDVLVVQEVEPLESVLLFAGEGQPTCRERIGGSQAPKRAIAAFSYSATNLTAVDSDQPMFSFRRYRAEREGLVFHVVGVWTVATKDKATSYCQAVEGIRRHADWIQSRPTVILGDFNSTASFRPARMADLLERLEPLGLRSAYHEYLREDFGTESRPTYYHRGRRSEPFHLDYCFVPATWVPHITRVEVGTHEDWGEFSDHMPLIVDVDV
jgi:hypothetical protein